MVAEGVTDEEEARAAVLGEPGPALCRRERDMTTPLQAGAAVRPQRYVHHNAVTRRVFNPLVVLLHTTPVLFVRGRISGKRLAVPMDPPFTWEGRQYLVSPMGNGHWARNLRPAGEGELRIGRTHERFHAVELQGEERDAIVKGLRGDDHLRLQALSQAASRPGRSPSLPHRAGLARRTDG